MPQAEPSLASVWTVSSTLPGSSPMMTALPPAATTSAAVWRPIPLLPHDHQLLPREDGHGHRPTGLRHAVVQALEPVHGHCDVPFAGCLLNGQPGRGDPAAHRQTRYRRLRSDGDGDRGRGRPADPAHYRAD